MTWGRRVTDKGQEDPMMILARIDERLDNYITYQKKHEQEDHERFTDYGKRLSSLELKDARNMGVSAGVAAVVGFIFKFWK